MVYKSLSGLATGYIWDIFKYVTDVNVRSTRNADKSKLYLSGRKNPEKVHRELLLLRWNDVGYHSI